MLLGEIIYRIGGGIPDESSSQLKSAAFRRCVTRIISVQSDYELAMLGAI